MHLSLTEPTTVPSRASSLIVNWYWLLGRNSGLLSLASRSFSSILAQDSESELKSGVSGESLASGPDRAERELRRLEELLRFSSILLLRRLGERRRRFERLLFTRCSLDLGPGVVVVVVVAVVVVVSGVVVTSKSSSLSSEGPLFLLASANTRDSLLDSSLEFLSPAAFPFPWASALL